MKLKATRDLILVKLEPKKTELVIPDSMSDKLISEATKGEAVSVGPECKEVKVGDMVHYNNYVGNEIKDEDLKGGIFIIVQERDILCRKSQ